MQAIEQEIKKLVDTETRAWDTQNAELLASLFHPDMVWPWPQTNTSHDPMDWVMPYGRYNHDRWRNNWQQLFDTHTLIHNHREIKKIVVSDQGDGAFAMVLLQWLISIPYGVIKTAMMITGRVAFARCIPKQIKDGR